MKRYEYRIDIYYKNGQFIETHYTNKLMAMRERLMHNFGMKVDRGDGVKKWTLEPTVYHMSLRHSDGSVIDWDEFKELFAEYYGYYSDERFLQW